MKKTPWIFSLLFALGLAWGALRAAALQPDEDTLTLKDGRVVQGQIVEETNASVVILVQGVKRNFGRNFVSKVAYGSGAAQGSSPAAAGAGSPSAVPPTPPAGTIPSSPPKGNLVEDLSLRYKVPVADVVWVRRQGISDSDLSLVFLVAATAQVVPRAVVRLRLSGWSWIEIERHYGMEPEHIYYEPGPWAAYPYYYYPGAYAGGWGWGGWGWGGRWGGGWGGGWGRHGR